MAFLKNIKIPVKIFAGFGIVLALLLTIGITGGFSLIGANNNFKSYRAIARQSNEAGRVQSNLLEARLAVKNFIISPNAKSVETVKDRTNATLKLQETLLGLTANPEEKKVVQDSGQQLNTYLATFDKVTAHQAKRDDVVANTLDKVGPEMEKKLTAIMTSAYQDANTVDAFRAGMAQRNLLLMRLYVTKFLVTNSPAAVERAVKESANFRKSLQDLLAGLENPSRRKACPFSTREWAWGLQGLLPERRPRQRDIGWVRWSYG